MTTRRQFLASALAVPVADLVTQLAAAPDRPQVVDTHLHCFAGKDDKRFPYHEDAPYRPDEAATPGAPARVHGRGRRRLRRRRPPGAVPGRPPLPRTLPGGRQGEAQGDVPVLRRPRRTSTKRMRELAKKVPLVAARVHAYNPDRLPPFGKPELRACGSWPATWGWRCSSTSSRGTPPGFEPYIKEFKDGPRADRPPGPAVPGDAEGARGRASAGRSSTTW